MNTRTTKLLALLLTLAMLLALAACTGEKPTESSDPAPAGSSQSGGETDPHAVGSASQGVTDTTIRIGSNYVYSGAWAYIGVPVVDAMKSVFARVNANGGIDGHQIEFIHYDDGNDPATGAAMIEKMVEEDKVFALNMVGGNVVNTSLDYMKEYGVPVVYISSGLAICYEENVPDSNIFPVQPSAVTAGKALIARLLHEPLFGADHDEYFPDGAKIGVIIATAENSLNALEGIEAQAELEGVYDQLVVETVTADTYATAIQKMKGEGVAVLVNTIQDSKGLIAAMDDAGWEVPVFGSFGTSTTQSYSPETYSPNRPVYCCSWADYSGEEGARMLADLADALTYNTELDEETRKSYESNNYACAGYFAAMTMVEGLQRIADLGWDFTWDNLREVYQSQPVKFDAMGDIDYSNGTRLGVTSLSLCEYTVIDGVGYIVDREPFESVEQIMKK